MVDTTVAGRLLVRVTRGSRTSDSSGLEASVRAAGKSVTFHTYAGEHHVFDPLWTLSMRVRCL